jgi:hypothetical protein
MAFALTACYVDAGALRQRTYSYTVAGTVRALVVNDHVGSVHVTGSGTSRAVVTEHISYRHTNPRTSHHAAAGTLTLDDNCPGNETCSVTYDISIPRSATVQVSSNVGVLQLTSLTSRLTAHTNAGDIEISRLSGPVDLTDHAGSILGNISSARATLRSSVGSINVTWTAVPTEITATTAVGSVALTVPGGVSYAVDAHTTVGSSQVGVSRNAGSAHVITASTRTGSVTIEPAS